MYLYVYIYIYVYVYVCVCVCVYVYVFVSCSFMYILMQIDIPAHAHVLYLLLQHDGVRVLAGAQPCPVAAPGFQEGSAAPACLPFAVFNFRICAPSFHRLNTSQRLSIIIRYMYNMK